MQRPRATAIVATLLAASSWASAQTQAEMPALLSGQSNAHYLSAHLPPRSHVLVAESGQSILRWDWLDTGSSGALGRAFLDALGRYRFSVLVWWQGDSDAQMPASEYERRLVTLLNTAQVPVMLIEILDNPSIRHIKAVHEKVALHPAVALIPTRDLPRDGDTQHFEARAYDVVTERLLACYFTQCWLTQ